MTFDARRVHRRGLRLLRRIPSPRILALASRTRRRDVRETRRDRRLNVRVLDLVLRIRICFDRRVRRAAGRGFLDGDERRLQRGVVVFPRRDDGVRRRRDIRLLRRVPLAEAPSFQKPVVQTPKVGAFRRGPGRRGALGRRRRTEIRATLAGGVRGWRRRRIRGSLRPLVDVFPLVLVLVDGDRLRLRGRKRGNRRGRGERGAARVRVVLVRE